MKTKKIFITLPFVFAAFTGNGQNSDKFTGSLLWKISGNGLEQPSYIFGTHHLADVSFAQGYPGFAEALEYARQIAGEIDMSEMTAAQTEMMRHAAMPADTTYAGLLSQAQYNLLDEGLKNHLGAGLDQLGQLKPAMLTDLLSMKLLTEAMPELNPMTHLSIDRYVQDKGTEAGKKVMGLETAADQIHAMFYVDPLEVQAQSLLCVLSEMESGKESIIRLNEFYASGDLFGAYDMVFDNPDDPDDPCQMSEAFALAINKNRNDKWVKELPGIFADGPTFVAVGMLHLCGQEGILYQLDRLGYTVEAIK